MDGKSSLLANESQGNPRMPDFVDSKATYRLTSVDSAKKLMDLDRLLSIMLHQIRNHCVTIKGYTSMLNYEDGMTEKGSKWLSKITRGIGSLEQFLKDFEKYRISKIEKKELLNVNINVRQIWSNLKDIYNIDTDKIDMDINIPPDAVIYADRNNFIKMTYHIIKNAVESIDNEGKIEIDFSKGNLSGKSADSWILEVKDSGCGMTDIEKKKASEILFSSKEFHIGCGLNLIAAVAIKLEAELEIETEKDYGTIIRITKSN